MTTAHTESVWERALEKWAEIGALSPDLAPALDLQRGMLRLLMDAAEGLADPDVPLPDFSPGGVLGKWRRGVPALRGVKAAMPAALKELPLALCGMLEAGGAGDSARHIKDALAGGEIDAGSLLNVSFARNQKAIRTSALHHGFSPDLVWLVGELASSPLAYVCQTRLLESSHLREAAGEWDRGYCPCCGSWPAFIEAIDAATPGDDTRMLRCSFCAAAWEMKSCRCVYCGNADERFVAAAPDPAHAHRRLELCGSCGHYTKVLAAAAPTPFPLIAVEDLATLELDRAAMERGYGRPALFDLDTIDPPATPNCS